MDQFQHSRAEHGSVYHVVGRQEISLAKHLEQDLPQFASCCRGDLLQLQMPLGFPVEEGVEILVGQIIFQCDVALSKHFDGKISDESVPTANGEPQEIGLFLVTALNKEFNFALSQRPKSRDDLATDSLERIQCSC